MENNENFYIHPYLIVSSISRSELKAKRKKKEKKIQVKKSNKQ